MFNLKLMLCHVEEKNQSENVTTKLVEVVSECNGLLSSNRY